MSTEIVFTEAEGGLQGKRPKVVSDMIRKLVEAEGELVTFSELMEGIEHPHQYTPALHALELVGAIERWEYLEAGHTKRQNAYCLSEGVKVVDAE